MSNMSVGINWIDGISIEDHLPQDKGRASFRMRFATDYEGYAGHQDKISISLTANAASVAKFERIAAFINEVMAEDDTADQGLVEAIAAE